ncbi:isocitrate lyase/phosphoenolpyruvate mutase family protein, partial [Streptococcus pneumoniae]|nr:isocitrate lyase/phosphoenolpyruvate mutase family protein [Streptococcus pneumoniae]
IWISSLCDSIIRGKPDMEVVNITDRLQTIDDILCVTEKHIIVDIDSGGTLAQTASLIEKITLRKIAGIVIEDKIGQKYNS